MNRNVPWNCAFEEHGNAHLFCLNEMNTTHIITALFLETIR